MPQTWIFEVTYVQRYGGREYEKRFQNQEKAEKFIKEIQQPSKNVRWTGANFVPSWLEKGR